MKSKTTIATKISIASMAFAILAGPTTLFAAESEHREGGPENGRGDRRVEQRDRQNQIQDRGDRSMRGRPGPEMRMRGGNSNEGRRMGQSRSPEQSSQQGGELRQARRPQQFGDNQGQQTFRGSRNQAPQGQRSDRPNFQHFRRPGSQFQDRGNLGANRFRGQFMPRGGNTGSQNLRMRRAFAMRQMAQNFRSEMARPSMRGQMFRNHRGPSASEGKSRRQIQQRSDKVKRQGRHQEVREGKRKGNGSKQSGIKNRGRNKDRSVKNKKGMRSRRSDQKGEKGKRNGHKGNRLKHS